MAKILLHTLLFPPDANSNAYIFGDLAKELKRLGHDIIILTTTPHYAVDEQALQRQPLIAVRGRWLFRSVYEGIPCYHIAVPPHKGGAKTRIITALKFHCLGFFTAMGDEFKCDIVLSQSPPLSIGLLSACIARRHGAKSIYVAQDIFPDGLIRQGKIKNFLLIRLLRLLERLVYKQSDAICSISDGLVEVLRSRVPKNKILRSIPNFVNTDLYKPLSRKNAFATTHMLDDKFVVSYVGNLGNAQDFTPVLEAAAACRDLPIKFLLVGSGIKEKMLADEIARRGLDNIELTGYQSRERTPLINAASDLCLVLLSPHVLNFSFPSKVYTLMACGKPILLYGHPEADVAKFVRDEGVGWVISSGDLDGFVDILRKLCLNRSELAEYGKRANTTVCERFTAQVVGEQYHALIQDLIATD